MTGTHSIARRSIARTGLPVFRQSDGPVASRHQRVKKSAIHDRNRTCQDSFSQGMTRVYQPISTEENTRTLPCGCSGERSRLENQATFARLRQRMKPAPPASRAAAAQVPGSGTRTGAPAIMATPGVIS